MAAPRHPSSGTVPESLVSMGRESIMWEASPGPLDSDTATEDRSADRQNARIPLTCRPGTVTDAFR